MQISILSILNNLNKETVHSTNRNCISLLNSHTGGLYHVPTYRVAISRD